MDYIKVMNYAIGCFIGYGIIIILILTGLTDKLADWIGETFFGIKSYGPPKFPRR